MIDLELRVFLDFKKFDIECFDHAMIGLYDVSRSHK